MTYADAFTEAVSADSFITSAVGKKPEFLALNRNMIVSSEMLSSFIKKVN